MGAGAVIGTGGCGEIRGALGVYVVGAIDPADRAVVESHLAWCVDCREELAGLAGLPGQLGSVPATDVTMLVLGGPGPPARDEEDPPEATLRSLLGRAAALRRHRLWRRVAAVAAVAAVAVIAGGGAVAVSQVVDPPALHAAVPALPWAATVHGRDPHTGAGAAVKYVSQPWGLQAQVQVSGISPGTRCELLVLGPGGREVAGGWTVAAGQTDAWYPASAPLAASGARGFVVVTAGGTSLVNVPIR
jgi:Putative zinc-finger